MEWEKYLVEIEIILQLNSLACLLVISFPEVTRIIDMPYYVGDFTSLVEAF